MRLSVAVACRSLIARERCGLFLHSVSYYTIEKAETCLGCSEAFPVSVEAAGGVFVSGRFRFLFRVIAGLFLVVALFPFAAVRADAEATVTSTRPGPLRVVLDDNYPPFIFRDGSGILRGILVDQWRLFGERAGIRVELFGMDWSEALSRMASGDFDVIDTVFRSEDRERVFDFSEPYAPIDVPIFFRSELSGIADASSLQGFRVAVKKGDAAIRFLESHGVRDLVEYDSYEKIVTAARSRDVAVFVVDEPPAHYFLYRFGLREDFRQSEPLYGGFFHRAVRKGDVATMRLLETGFSAITDAEYREIDRRWMGDPLGNGGTIRAFQIAFVVAGIVAVILLVIVGTLRKMVRIRTEALQEQMELAQARAEELKESEDRYRQLFEMESDAIFLIEDDGGRILEVNRAAELLYGYSREELLAFRNTDVSAEPDETTRATLEGMTSIPTRWHRKKDGTVFPVEIRATHFDWRGRRVHIAAIRDITEREATEEQLRFLSFHDALTGLYNRTYFEEELDRLDHRRTGAVGLLVADVDGLKLVNDTLGHGQGDALLVDTARVLENVVRKTDIVARIGGDEFTILLPGADESLMEHIVGRIGEALRDRGARAGTNSLAVPRLSLGWAMSADPATPMRTAFRVADDRMYRDKLHRKKTGCGAFLSAIADLQG